MAEEFKEEVPSVDTSTDEATMEDVPVNENQPPPRLMITKMELENFKSYGGVKEIGPFHKCFSSVVGPNGSGKSNVIDAMLFVFGKRAKKLRLNKVSELIHKSDSVKNNPPTFARVSVFFQEIIDRGDGDAAFDVVPNTQHVVTRIAKRDNSSTYKLDGKNCSFREVGAFLGSKGIDLDNNRFLILQGEVEMISMMPPKGKTEDDDGLLEYLEDIIGSSKFVEDTNLAAEKVEQLTEQRQEKLNRVKAVEKEKDSLEDAKQEAEALLTKEREIRRKRNILLQINSMKETNSIDSLTEKKVVVAEKLEAEQAKESETKKGVKELEKALKAQTIDYNKICDELKITKDEFTSYERREIKLQEDTNYAKGALKKAQTKVTTETKKEAAAIEKGQEAEESIPGLEERCTELAELKSNEDEKLDEIQEHVKEITKEIRVELDDKIAELAPVDQELSEFKNALDTAETEVKLLKDSTSQAKKRLVESEKELASMDEKEQSKRDELDKCENDLKEARTRLNEVGKERDVLRGKQESLVKRSSELTAQAEEAKAALQAVGNTRSRTVQAILKAAKPGGDLANLGILGRLGDLATTTAEYDVAASTASGMLDHIVTKTTKQAQRCLDYLREKNLGRANFCPLDKMKRGAHDRPVETPEGAPRLFDLITPCNPDMAPVLFLAYNNTLVAPDMTTAHRWAYESDKRWRVVTVDGNLIETSGTMSGGGKSVKRGGMRISNGKQARAMPLDQASEANCKKLEQEAEKARGLADQCRQRQRDLVDEARSLERSIKTMNAKIPKLRMEIESFDTSREELTKLIPELRTKCELTPEEAETLNDLKKKVEKCKSDMSSCAKLSEKLTAKVSKLQKSILDAGGSKLKEQQAACEKILKDLNETEKSLNSAKVTITTSKKAAAKAKKQKEAAEMSQKECSETLEKLKSEFNGMEEKAQSVKEAFESVKEIENKKRAELDEAKKECEEMKKGLADARVIEIDLQGQVEAFDRQLHDCKQRKNQYAKQIKKLLSAAEQDDDDEFDFSDDEDEPDKEDEDKSIDSDEVRVDGDGDVEMETAEGAEDQDEEKPKEDSVQSKSSLPTFSFAALEKYNVDDIKGDIASLESEKNTLAKNANMGAIEEYHKKEADYLARVGELDEVTEARNACRKEHEELRRKRLEMFMEGFGKITLKLKEMYQMITLGGDAELELVDSLDPFSEGIVFSVRPPKKSWKNISNLSGGEKTLSSLALVFALHHYKPTPLYVMDEIDAALDFKNVSIVANYIKERTKNAQFIIISLRNNMFELADRLVGIYKTSNITSSITINPKAFSVEQSQNGATTTPRGRVSSLLGDKTNNVGQSPAVSAGPSKRQRSLSGGGHQEMNTA